MQRDRFDRTARALCNRSVALLASRLVIIAGVALGPSADAQTQPPLAPDLDATPGAEQKPAAESAPIAWPGTFSEGFEQIRQFAEKQQLESAQKIADALLAPNSFLRWKLDFAARGGWRARAVKVADPLLDVAGWNGLDPNTRAEVWFAKGVVATLAKDREAAEADFWKARGTTTDASLQRDAIYDLGSIALQAGEEARAKLPEISGQPAPPPAAQPTAPGSPGAPPPGAPGAAQAPDPLQVAREAYLLARDRFVERLRDQWQDADTQADVELCLKRLRELDDIEKKRKEEEQKKKDEQQKKDQQKKQDQDKKDKDKDKQDQKDKPDQNGKDDPNKEPEKPKDEDKKKPEDKKPDQPKDQKDKDADKDKKKDAQPTEKQNEQMSPEEMTQLLDRLQRIEEEHRKIEAQLRAMRRAKVKKDW
jgi:hypothetical protein